VKVWVLTCEHNSHDDFGQIFLAVFKDLPDPEALADFIMPPPGATLNSLLKLILHVQKGGGRIADEDTWYYLKQVELK
jgi:hypothetical protein